MKFLEPTRKPKVIYTDNSSDLAKADEELTWNHCTSTPHRLETNGIAERAVRWVKEGTSVVLLQSGLDIEWWADSMECCCYLRKFQDLLSDGKDPLRERRSGLPFNRPATPFGAMVEYHPSSAKDLSRLHQFGPKVLPSTFLGYVLSAGGIWNGDIMVADIGGDGRMWTPRPKAPCKGSVDVTKKWKLHFPRRRWNSQKVPFVSLMDLFHHKNFELEPQFQKYKGRVVLRGDIVKYDSGSYAVFTEQGSSASQMTAAKVMDIISRLPGCARQAADAVSADTQVKMEDAHKLFKNSKSECPDIWKRLPKHKWPKSCPVWKIQSFLLNEICTVILWQDSYGKGNLRKSYWNTDGRKFQIRMPVR